MPTFGMLIDTNKCIGCFACRVACQNQWQMPANEAFIKMQEIEKGKFPRVKITKVMTQCNHCDNPPCLNICPTKATYKNKNGLVLVDAKRCIGCKSCMAACPYGARIWSDKEDVPQKCKFCADFLLKGELPACVTSCVGQARIFGDLDNPDSAISKAIIARNAKSLLSDLGTKPKVYYVI